MRADGPSAFNGSSPYFCWTYDNFGNRTSQNSEITGAFTVVSTVGSQSCTAYSGVTPTTDTQSYNSYNQLTGTTHPSGSFSYDDAGAITSDPANNYAYDAEGRLCAMSTWSTVLDKDLREAMQRTQNYLTASAMQAARKVAIR